jgi:hypothetical protein
MISAATVAAASLRFQSATSSTNRVRRRAMSSLRSITLEAANSPAYHWETIATWRTWVGGGHYKVAEGRIIDTSDRLNIGSRHCDTLNIVPAMAIRTKKSCCGQKVGCISILMGRVVHWVHLTFRPERCKSSSSDTSSSRSARSSRLADFLSKAVCDGLSRLRTSRRSWQPRGFCS